MVFSSFVFLFIFLPVLFVLYFAVPARYREARNFILLAFSLFFTPMAASDISSHDNLDHHQLCFRAAGITQAQPAYKESGSDHGRRAEPGLARLLQICGFFLENLKLIGLPVTVPNIGLPIGISFFTFQGMSYVLDVYRGDAAAERNIAHVALYISLFPQLVAGPIVRYTTVAEAIHTRQESIEGFSKGGIRFCFGLAKMILANSLGVLADEVFTLPVSDLR